MNLDQIFKPPLRGFVSDHPAEDWSQSLLTGNGSMGALVMGHPHAEAIHLSHAGLYMPNLVSDSYLGMDMGLTTARRDCLNGEFRSAAEQIDHVRHKNNYHDERDQFIAACTLHITQPTTTITRYQRSVDFMAAETCVAVAGGHGISIRSAFVSRPADALIIRINGSGRQSAKVALSTPKSSNERDREVMAAGIANTKTTVEDGAIRYHCDFANTNQFNPSRGYEVIAVVSAKGGKRVESATGISIEDAEEILVFVRIRLLQKDGKECPLSVAVADLNELGTDYASLRSDQVRVHGGMMGRVSLSLDAPAEDRAKPSEVLNADARCNPAPLAMIERAFDAGRYNIICSTGQYIPNLQGLWSATSLSPWSGSVTTNGNLPCAISFLLMGNTPELMHAYFRFHDERMDGFRQNAKVLYGTRGIHIPAQVTMGPWETDFTPIYPHLWWYAGAAWTALSYYDYYRYSGDAAFLAQRAYPLMREAAAFYEDFLTVSDDNGRLVFAPSFSPENAPGGEENCRVAINATMEIGAARQLLGNAIAAARFLGVDADLQQTWATLISRLPEYQVAPDGSFREWLWPGLEESHVHRHVSQLYQLFDDMPAEITGDPRLAAAAERTIRLRLPGLEKSGFMAFGVVQNGLAAAHLGNAELAQRAINLLVAGFWTTGMGSLHNRDNLFNVDISGGFPYLCSSVLVYADLGIIRFFPARPAQWTRGTLRGVRLRGGIMVESLAWGPESAYVVLVSDIGQQVTIEAPGFTSRVVSFTPKQVVRLDL
jgi:alpha-L-fucosidase 2